jgi:hypothetical protein
MPKKKKSATKEGMSPEEVAAANKDGINFLTEKFPMLTMDQGQGFASDAWDSMMGKFVPMLSGMVQSGYDNFAANPSKTATAVLADQTLGTNTADLPGVGVAAGGGEEELSPYEMRIRELMTNRGMTREQAVGNQAGAMSAGGDINDNGAITNDEWAQKLGSDLDNDGNVTNQEFAQWKQQNPDHQAAGGTKYSGLPGENGLFAGQMAQGMQDQQGQQQVGQPTYPQPTQQQPQVSPQAPPGGVPPGVAVTRMPQVANGPVNGRRANGFINPKRRGGPI